MSSRLNILDRIKHNIDNYGYHLYLVKACPSPRFFYTIGASELVNVELIFAGGIYYSKEEVGLIIKQTIRLLQKNNIKEFYINSLGEFSLQVVHKSWKETLMIGAIDYYQEKEVKVIQIIPEKNHKTIDVPDMSVAWSLSTEPVWQWEYTDWNLMIPISSIAITNLDALYGDKIIEATKWEEIEWELFAGRGPDMKKEEMRIVPIGTLLAHDETLKPVLDLPIGEALWREKPDYVWHIWD